jgi:hypothetical protein
VAVRQRAPPCNRLIAVTSRRTSSPCVGKVTLNAFAAARLSCAACAAYASFADPGVGVMHRATLLAVVLSALPLAAHSQSANYIRPPLTYSVKTLSFDRWCIEEQRYPSSRCDRRLAADVAAFEDYRARVERYDLEYEMERTREYEFERDVLKRDHSQQPAPPDVTAPLPH